MKHRQFSTYPADLSVRIGYHRVGVDKRSRWGLVLVSQTLMALLGTVFVKAGTDWAIRRLQAAEPPRRAAGRDLQHK